MKRKTLRPTATALLNPKADPIFKILFTDHSKQANIALTEFLSAILEMTVTNVKLLPNVLSGETKEDRQTQFDLTCKLANDEFANVEMQGQNEYKSYDRRAEYQVAHLLNHFSKRGMKWENTPAAFQVSVVNFVYNKKTEDGLTCYTMRSEKGDCLANRLNIIFMELPKYKKFRNSKPSDLTTVQKWGTFFLYANDPNSVDFIEELAREDYGIMNVLDVLSRISRSERNWFKETNYWMNVSNLRSLESQAIDKGLKEGLDRGLKEGMEKGIEQGIQQGIKQGIEQGIQQGIGQGLVEGEAKAKLETAVMAVTKLHNSIELVAETFNVPIEDLKKALEK